MKWDDQGGGRGQEIAEIAEIAKKCELKIPLVSKIRIPCEAPISHFR
jgi:hypothetical protein